MAKTVAALTAVRVKTEKTPGYHGDGDGLYLQVTEGGAKSWIFRYTFGGRRREMGLGRESGLSLAQAREKASEARKQLGQGQDPIEARKAAEVEAEREAASASTFKQCAEAYIEAHRAGWRNAKHADQWGATLATYAYPLIGGLAVGTIDTMRIMDILQPIWAVKAETASRLRGRIEVILDWASVHGYRSGDNPARWRGHLQALLPAKGKVAKVEHHAALPYRDLPDFFLKLQAQDGVSARALEFAILTAARTGEVLGATWAEFDLDDRVWVVPAVRMKGGKEHRVPLSEAALVLLRKRHAVREGGYVFAGQLPRKRRPAQPAADSPLGNPLSSMAMLMVLRRMKRGDLTVHGFRSTFRDWVAEQTDFANEVAEMALAHAVGDKVEAAYRRGSMFEKRQQLAEAWGRHCTAGAARASSSSQDRAPTPEFVSDVRDAR